MQSVLAVGGLDPSGCAGLAADVRAGVALGVHVAPVASCLTDQDTRDAYGTYPVADAIFSSSLAHVASDLRPRAVKTGLLGAVTQAHEIVNLLDHLKPALVVDPVMKSSTGRWLSEHAFEATRALMPHATIVTPNAHELAALTQTPADTLEQSIAAARVLLQDGAKAVLVKSGHLAQQRGTDALVTTDAVHVFEGFELYAEHARGTGCSLATAIACGLSQGVALTDAVERARAFVRAALRGGAAIGSGAGPASVRKPVVGKLHVLTHDVQIAHAALDGGADVIQLRDKNANTRVLLASGHAMRALCERYGAMLIVDDRVDVAHAINADGVHLGALDLPPRHARALLGPHKLIGGTVNSLDHLLTLRKEALNEINYVGIGPVFGTKSKIAPPPALGLDGFASLARQSPWPVIAIGSVQHEHVQALRSHGAHGVAVISAISDASDRRAAAQALRRAVDGATS